MPDLERERRLRERYNLDLPVTFRIDVGGVRDGVGRYRPNFISFTAWCRREDPQPATVNATDAGCREASDIALVARYDVRLVPNTSSTFTVDGVRYTLSRIEEVGRNRYMVLHGMHSS